MKEKIYYNKIIDFTVIIDCGHFLFIVRNYVIKFKSCEAIKFLLGASSMPRYEAQIELHHRETGGSNTFKYVGGNPWWSYHLSSLRSLK